MGRWNGTPVEATPTATATPRFSGTPVEQGDTLGGFGKSVATGLRGGVEALAGAGGDLINWEKRKAAQIAASMGASPETVKAIETYGDTPTRGPPVINTEAVQGAVNQGVSALPQPAAAAVQDITQHQAQGPLEQAGQTFGAFLPNAIGPGGPLAAAARVAIPTAATETAGALTKQIAPEYEEKARMVAGLLSAGGVGLKQSGFRLRRTLAEVGTDPASVARVKQLLLEQGMSPEDAAAAMQQLGPDAMRLDTGPVVRQEAQQIQARGGEGRGLLDKPLREREAGKNERLEADVTAAVGPEVQRIDVLSGLKDRAAALGPEYDAAHAASQPVNTQTILDDITTDLTTARGEARGTLEGIRRDLMKPGTTDIDTTTAGLHEARKAIDGQLYDAKSGAPRDIDSNVARKLKDYRAKIDAALGEAGPIKDVDAKRAQIGDEERAYKQGEKLYRTDDKALSPEEFSRTYDTMEPGAKARLLDGVNRETWKQIGISGNDLVALKGILKGSGKWNHQKLASVIGEEKTAAMMQALEREATFNESYGKVVQGSKTAESQTTGKRGFGAAVKDAIPEVALAWGAGGPGGAGAVALSHMRRYAADRMSGPAVGANDPGVARLLASNRPDDLAEAIRIISEHKSGALPPAVLAALLARQQEVSDRRDQRR